MRCHVIGPRHWLFSIPRQCNSELLIIAIPPSHQVTLTSKFCLIRPFPSIDHVQSLYLLHLDLMRSRNPLTEDSASAKLDTPTTF